MQQQDKFEYTKGTVPVMRERDPRAHTMSARLHRLIELSMQANSTSRQLLLRFGGQELPSNKLQGAIAPEDNYATMLTQIEEELSLLNEQLNNIMEL